MPEVTGYVLSGGKGRRMGRPKCQVEINGRPMQDFAIDTLRGAFGDRVSLIGSRARSSHSVRSIPDILPAGASAEAGGPAVAIYSALADADGASVFVLACDMPLVTVELVKLLARKWDGRTSAVLPRQSDGRLQPLCGVYGPTCLPVFRDAIISGNYEIKRILDPLDTLIVEPTEYAMLPRSELFFTNVNTPADVDLVSSAVSNC